MVITLLRPTKLFSEEYGKVIFDGQNVTFEGLSDIFIKFLNYGLSGTDGKKYKPTDGLNFMLTLKNGFIDLVASETQ